MSEPARVSSSLRSRVLDGDPLFVGKVIQQVFYFGQSSVGICLLLVGLCGAGDRRQTTEILRVNVFYVPSTSAQQQVTTVRPIESHD